MESVLFKHIFSVLLLILTEGKEMIVYTPDQLNFCLFTENKTEAHQWLYNTFFPGAILFGMPSYTDKGENYSFSYAFPRTPCHTSLSLFALFLFVSPLFREKYL
ncbi:MAG: hypothetical protein LUG18_16180 [Candidatus Azobacteroides sp.]|nr:hypothetical protein [Candidatus Azobacteroides sp.]